MGTERARSLARGFAVLTGITYALLVLGALVRANGAGLACPDWPLCFGQLVPTFDMRIAFEWGHRALAGGVSLGLLALTAFAGPLRRQIAAPLLLAWVLLAVQVVLGGLTVLLQLAPWTVTAHLLVGTSFCVCLLWIARCLYEPRRQRRTQTASGLLALGALAALLLVAQLALGGMVASHGAGLACSSFPTCNGAELAPTLSGMVGLQVLHRAGAFALLAICALLAWLARHEARSGRIARIVTQLVAIQICVGIANVLLRLPIEVTALHSATAAAIALATALLLRELHYAPLSAELRAEPQVSIPAAPTPTRRAEVA